MNGRQHQCSVLCYCHEHRCCRFDRVKCTCDATDYEVYDNEDEPQWWDEGEVRHAADRGLDGPAGAEPEESLEAIHAREQEQGKRRYVLGQAAASEILNIINIRDEHVANITALYQEMNPLPCLPCVW